MLLREFFVQNELKGLKLNMQDEKTSFSYFFKLFITILLTTFEISTQKIISGDRKT